MFSLINLIYQTIKDVLTTKEYDFCRCCGVKLPDKYGCGIVFIGNGFCKKCAINILNTKTGY